LVKKLLDYIVVTLTLILISSGIGFAQGSEIGGINLGVKVGGSKLLGESPKGTSGFINEFDNKFGLASGIEISKYISPRWEIAAEFSYSELRGDTDSPDLTAEGKHPVVPANLEEPVEYINKLSGYNLLFRYYFIPANSESAIHPFIGAGAGYIKYNSVFKYKDAPDNETIFSKGKDSWTLSTPGYYVGVGFNSSFTSNLYLKTSLDFKFVNYGFLDVVHNFNEDGTKQEILGLFTEFKVALFFNLSGSGSKNKNNSSRGLGKSSGTSYLPFSR
jgi:hypothetical protein